MKKNSTADTLQFHFALIYILAAFISLSIIISSLVLANQLISRYNHYATVTEPMKYQLQAFNIDVNKQAAFMKGN